jgi:hypothetical protein
MATVIPIGPRIREREYQAALDQAAADRGWPPDPWRLRKPGAKSRPRRGENPRPAGVSLPPRLRVVR